MDEEEPRTQVERPRKRHRYRDLESAEEDWSDNEERDTSVPLKDQRRRHRDPEEADERRESERRERPGHHGRDIEDD